MTGSGDGPVDADVFEVDGGFLTIGRTYEEYRAMFDLGGHTGSALAGRVLDCPAGVGSFVAGARERGRDAVGVDLLYDRPRAEIERLAREDCRANVEQLRTKRELFEWSYYGDIATRAAHLRRAFRTFLADYPAGPYVAGALPDLPFADGAFDLALSANLLFLYDDRLDYAFHRAALVELARVADEVRLFPLASLDTDRSVFVSRALADLRAMGLVVETRAVPYEFQPGATEMLVLRGDPFGDG